MKRILILCLMIILIAGAASAEGAGWEKRFYVDEFGDDTDTAFLTTDIGTGTFSNSATTNSELAWTIRVEKRGVSFVLAEYGSHIVKNDYDDKYTVTLRDDNGTDYTFSAKGGGASVVISDAVSFIRLLAVNKSPRINIKEETRYYSTTSTYKLGVLDTTGFTELYKEAFGEDWSLPLSIVLSAEEVKIPTGKVGTTVIEVSIYLGTDRIECDYNVDFDYELVNFFLKADAGVDSITYHYETDWKNRNENYIYIKPSSGTKFYENRSGYVTVSIADVSERCLITIGDVEEADSEGYSYEKPDYAPFAIVNEFAYRYNGLTSRCAALEMNALVSYFPFDNFGFGAKIPYMIKIGYEIYPYYYGAFYLQGRYLFRKSSDNLQCGIEGGLGVGIYKCNEVSSFSASYSSLYEREHDEIYYGADAFIAVNFTAGGHLYFNCALSASMIPAGDGIKWGGGFAFSMGTVF